MEDMWELTDTQAHTHTWFSPTENNEQTFEIPDDTLIILIIKNDYH